MSGPSRTAWPWLVAAIVGSMTVVGAFVALVASPAPFLDAAVWSFTGLGPLAVGALLVARRPHNPVGRLLVLIGFVWSVGEAARILLWLDTALGPLPATDLAAWIVAWSGAPAWVLILFLLAIFPSGRVESAWLKWPIRVGLVLLVYWAVSAMVMPLDLGEFYGFLEGRTYPWAIEALATVVDEYAEIVEALDVVANPAMLGLLTAVDVDLVRRWRRSSGQERLQMQWFGLGVGVMVAMFAASAFRAASGATEDVWGVVTLVLALNAPVAAIGVAVARFRLYDLDRLVSRTVSYTVVAGVVACVYAGAVLIARSVFSAQSQLTVAASTLAAAAAFAPLRRGVLGWVDRRFNRARYDAQLEVERFGRRLRGQLEARALSDELVEVVHQTVQPKAATVWIRELSSQTPGRPSPGSDRPRQASR